MVTGSDTSTNAMFGSLQRVTAERLGLNPILIVASNSTGGVMGKMIAARASWLPPRPRTRKGGEGRILPFVLPHSILLAALSDSYAVGGLRLSRNGAGRDAAAF